MKTNFFSSVKAVGILLVAGLVLTACERNAPEPLAPAGQAQADARAPRNVFQPGYYRAESVLQNEPTHIVLSLTAAANTSAISQALDAAIQRYNALGLNITFSRSSAAGAGKQYFVTVDNQQDPSISSSGVQFANISSDAGTDEFISSSMFPVQINGNANTVEPSRTVAVNAKYALAKGNGYLTNLLVKELGHVIGVENTDIRGTRIAGTSMTEVDYITNGIRYRKNQLNGTPVRVIRATAPSPTSVFAVGGVSYSPAAASFNAQDQQILRTLYGK